MQTLTTHIQNNSTFCNLSVVVDIFLLLAYLIKGTKEHVLGLIWRLCDLDHNNVITKNEMVVVMANLNKMIPLLNLKQQDGVAQMKQVFRELDFNHNGELERDEFLSGASQNELMGELVHVITRVQYMLDT